MGTEYRVVTADDHATRSAVYRFRYDIYVTEMGRRQSHADHGRGLITDPLDATGHCLAAFSLRRHPSRIIGTLRTNLLRRGPVGIYEDLYGLRDLDPEVRDRTSITTRLMVAREYRRGPLALLLASAMYDWGTRQGVQTDYIDCNPHLVRFFQRLGYHDLGRIEHPEYGGVHLMRLEHDLDYLTHIGSPLLAALTGGKP